MLRSMSASYEIFIDFAADRGVKGVNSSPHEHTTDASVPHILLVLVFFPVQSHSTAPPSSQATWSWLLRLRR